MKKGRVYTMVKGKFDASECEGNVNVVLLFKDFFPTPVGNFCGRRMSIFIFLSIHKHIEVLQFYLERNEGEPCEIHGLLRNCEWPSAISQTTFLDRADVAFASKANVRLPTIGPPVKGPLGCAAFILLLRVFLTT